jgi:hypothetical protein
MALAGAYDTLSGASAGLTSPSTIEGTVGSNLSYQIKITGPKVQFPQSWFIEGGGAFSNVGATTNGMPPGLAMSLSTGIIHGVPTQGGTYPVTITAFEYPNLGAPRFAFTLTFEIAGGLAPPIITTQPATTALHTGETLDLTVTANGTGPLSYQWQHEGADLSGQTGPDLAIPKATPQDAGSYVVRVTSPGGSVVSNPATVAIVPLSVESSQSSPQGTTLTLSTIAGRHYLIEATQSLTGGLWQGIGTVTASGSTTVFVDPAPANPERFWRYAVLP